MKEYVMGNSAIALGAMAAGVNLVAGYPGTPSSEILETVGKHNDGSIHVEWSVNEKVAMEVAAGAAYSGARTMVTMKMVGLNVASDPLMSLAYVGVEGALVVVCTDDPGPISSQTEQDTRLFAEFARIPVFDPCSPEDAYQMVQYAMDYSHKHKTPVILRPTTRICHAYASIESDGKPHPAPYDGFKKDAGRWVIFPRLAFNNHAMIEKRNIEMGRELSNYDGNVVTGESKKAILTSGISYAYVKEYIKDRTDVKVIRIATAYPSPEDFILQSLKGVDEVLVIEELSPYLELSLQRICGVHKLPINIYGKTTGHGKLSGENTSDYVAQIISEYIGDNIPETIDVSDMPALPIRPPVLCAGCPHRASFYAVKQAMKGREAYFCGDIGCYTLGNAMPLDMTDTCLCMGAGITVAQGLHWTNKEGVSFAFAGDSTFFASGMTGVVNAVYNEADMILCVLDNSTTAMTGHQPHPGTGINMMGDVVAKVDIVKILEGIGLKKIITVNPFDLKASVDAVKTCADMKGVKAIIFKAPCIAITKPEGRCIVDDDRCIGCKKCISEIGCPAIIVKGNKAYIESSQCTGCKLCSQICPVGAIGGADHE